MACNRVSFLAPNLMRLLNWGFLFKIHPYLLKNKDNPKEAFENFKGARSS